MSELEKLPRLLQRAIATLEKATTAGEILEAKAQAGAAYDAAKIAAHLEKIKGAHKDVMMTIHKVQADALAIDARAKIRLADEYDAAQERGEVRKKGGDYTSKVPNENLAPTSADIGLTKKEIHNARAVRDAEKKKPGAIRTMLDQKLEAGEEPTRADIKRTVNEVTGKSKGSRGSKGTKKTENTKKPTAPKRHYREDEIIALADKGLSFAAIATTTGIGQRQVRHVVERERIRREAKSDPEINRSELSQTAQEKLDAAIRQHKRRLDLEFEQRVLDEIKKRIDEIVLPNWKEKIDQAQNIYNRRRGFMDKATFNTIRRALHPDSRNSISDGALAKAFDTFMSLEKHLLDEKDSPTVIGDLPGSWDEWEKAKRAATAERRAKRTSGVNAVRRQ